MKAHVAVLLAAAMLAAFAGCGKKQGQNSDLLGKTTGTVAGVQWQVPSRWVPQGQRPMRAATYSIPPAEGDNEPAECAVFYFGNDQGGSVDANIDRWVGQFDNPTQPERGNSETNGMKVYTVKVAGSYLAPSGPMRMPTAKKDNYKLYGTIVQGPQGSVFFKMTGPAKTVDGAEKELDALIGSISK